MKNPSFGELRRPFPSQSSMQGNESEKKSNIQQFRMAMQNFRTACEMPIGVQVAR